jgi:hypothetical protein
LRLRRTGRERQIEIGSIVISHLLKAVIGYGPQTAALSRTAAVQPQKIAAPCINDRFSRGTAAVEGCVPRPKGELCKGRFLRIADVAQVRRWLCQPSSAVDDCSQPKADKELQTILLKADLR